jgi:hypothetical protein
MQVRVARGAQLLVDLITQAISKETNQVIERADRTPNKTLTSDK